MNYTFYLAFTSVCLVISFISAKLSLMTHSGGPAVLAFVGGQLSIFTWVWLLRQQAIKPWQASMLYDGIYGICWLLAFCVLDEAPNLIQAGGCLLIVLGIVVISAAS